jgi:hypothetical protein
VARRDPWESSSVCSRNNELSSMVASRCLLGRVEHMFRRTYRSDMVFFQYALAHTQTLGTIQWVPVAFVDTFVLIVVVKKLVERITGQKQKVTLS